MKIVLEGVNGCGKSTLAKYLSDHFNLKVFHPGPRPVNDEAAVLDTLSQLITRKGIFDRVTPISRLAYEGVDNLSENHVEYLNTFLNVMKKQFIFIYLIGEGEHILKPYYTDDHILDIRQNRKIIKKRYSEIFENIPHLKYDFRNQDPKDVIKYIESFGKGPDMREMMFEF